MGGCNFGIILPINVPKCHRGKIYAFWQEIVKPVRIPPSRSRFLPFHYGFSGSHEHSRSRRHNHSENCITVKVTQRTQKIEINLASEGSGLAFFSTDLGHFFGSNVGNEFGVMLRGKEPKVDYEIVHRQSLMI